MKTNYELFYIGDTDAAQRARARRVCDVLWFQEDSLGGDRPSPKPSNAPARAERDGILKVDNWERPPPTADDSEKADVKTAGDESVEGWRKLLKIDKS